MKAIPRKIFTPTLAAFVLLLGLAGPASAVEDDDRCDPGIPDPADIEKLTATFDNANGKITVVLDLCANPDNQTKYRIHLDHTAPFAGDPPFDCRGDSEPDLCCTTSDDTMMTRRNKDTGPGMITVSGDMITYMVTLAELGLDPQQGDTEVLIWADTQFKGISDRAPNTEFGDLCAKPESSAEVLALSLESQMIVFITSTIHRATLAGLAGADDICNARATAAGLPGTYTAWLSDSANDAKDRVTQATVPYVRTDGQQVATDFASLLSCPGGVCLDAPIQFDEFGSLVVGPQFNAVWTGTNSDGSSAAQIVFPTGHCNNWTSLGGFGVHGQFNAVGVRWTRPPFPAALTCTKDPGARLYCFQD